MLGPVRPLRDAVDVGTTRPLRDAVDAGEHVNLSHDQARQLGLLFFNQYQTRLSERLDNLIPGTRVSVKLDGRRQYGSLESTDGATGLVKLDGRGAEVVTTLLDKLLRRRTRLSRSLKKRWTRELNIMGGPSAIARAYRKWVKELKSLLIVVQHKSTVLALLARDHEVITLSVVRDVCGALDGITEPGRTSAILLESYIKTSEPEVIFYRRRGRYDSYAWADGARERALE
jgi:hypothetical protein